jgi:hypothetical protein
MYLIVLFAVACQNDKKSDVGAASGSAGTGSSAPVVRSGVEIFIDDKSVAMIAYPELEKWPRLDALVPEENRRLGTWDAVSFGATKLERPSQMHPDKVPVLFKNKDGKAAFGMFDPVEYSKHGEPGFRADDIKQVRIAISKMERGGAHQGTGEVLDPTKLVLKITTPQGEKQLTGSEILSLPREAQPGNEETKGWRVTQFLEAAGVTKYESIVLVDAGGTTVPLTKKELDPKTSNPFVKLNKQGQLRFRMFTKQGGGWQPGADLRALTSITVK